MVALPPEIEDSAELRKARGAFFTPEAISRFVTEWAVRERVELAGGIPYITTNGFFLVEPEARYSAVIGNPPYIRYQDFSGESRTRSRAAALKAGVALTALAQVGRRSRFTQPCS